MIQGDLDNLNREHSEYKCQKCDMSESEILITQVAILKRTNNKVPSYIYNMSYVIHVTTNMEGSIL